MGLRWYSTVIDSRDHRALAAWWAETLDWQVSFEDGDEAVIIPKWLDEDNPGVPFERVGPGLVFVPVGDDKTVKNRLHIDLAAPLHESQVAHVDALIARGATRADVGQGDDVNWVVLLDPEGNEFCVLSSRES
ncbi:putative GNAT superfamily acetyltransferase [Pseudoclavibacter sp. JAI123]|uniref:VOC family protein n=1 Tax=Pseudoclavibacter sp. JAI123 TaxID=2723065 RepID=UPI0015CB5321|nr:VOC family protein [Pseudoclavibacter sp. JAI123]NYF13253.1 putative GNAT superfamily acetyltransferase [Pseudoclavibacter sp. JAI123]